MISKLLASATTALLFASVPSTATAQTARTEIVVSASATVTLPPDVATVSAEVQTNSENAAQSVGRNSATYERVVAALSKIGIDRADVTLTGYNVNYNPPPHAGTIRQPDQQYGYTVVRDFNVKVRKLENAGAAVDAATAAGATSIAGVSFGLADPRAAQAQATERAVADARAKAEAIATAAGLHVTGIKSIGMPGTSVVVPMARMAAMAPGTAPTQFDASGVGVTASVDATFLASP